MDELQTDLQYQLARTNLRWLFEKLREEQRELQGSESLMAWFERPVHSALILHMQDEIPEGGPQLGRTLACLVMGACSVLDTSPRELLQMAADQAPDTERWAAIQHEFLELMKLESIFDAPAYQAGEEV